MLKALILCHPDFVPPKAARYIDSHQALWKTEYDVKRAFKKMGYICSYMPLTDRLSPLKEAVKKHKPSLIVNLLEELDGHAELESHIVTYLEGLQIPFTGCSSKGLLLCRHKAAAKFILTHKKILTPHFKVVYDGRRSKTRLRKSFFPSIIKYANEDASLGIQKASLVTSYSTALKQIRKMRQSHNSPILIERFIAGREFHLAAFSKDGKNIKVYKPIETVFTRAKNLADTIATEEFKWNLKVRRKNKIVLRPLKDEARLEKALTQITKKTYKALYLKGYARLDVRVDSKERIYVIDVNPNPDLGQGFELAEILRASGHSYTEMIRYLIPTSKKEPLGELFDLN